MIYEVLIRMTENVVQLPNLQEIEQIGLSQLRHEGFVKHSIVLVREHIDRAVPFELIKVGLLKALGIWEKVTVKRHIFNLVVA